MSGYHSRQRPSGRQFPFNMGKPSTNVNSTTVNSTRSVPSNTQLSSHTSSRDVSVRDITSSGNTVELLGFGPVGMLNVTRSIRADSFEVQCFFNVTLNDTYDLILLMTGVNSALANVRKGYINVTYSSGGGSTIFQFCTSYDAETEVLTIYVKDATNQVVVLAPGSYRMQIIFFSSICCEMKEFCFPIPPCNPCSRDD